MQSKTVNIYSNSNKTVQDAYAMLAANIHMGGGTKTCKTITITSCSPREGKTSLALSLANAIANSGYKVLLVDTDMRKPNEGKRLNSEIQIGLSDHLTRKKELCEILCKTNISNLLYLPCGSYPKDPASLLSSVSFEEFISRVKEEYDFILFDTPAISSVVDGALVSSKTDVAILVVKMGKTSLVSLNRAKEQLEKLEANIIGVVLNKVKKKDYKVHYSSYNYFYNLNQFLNNKKTRKDKMISNMQGVNDLVTQK